MATAGDVREILEIQDRPRPKKVKESHKLNTIGRELQSLMVDGHVPPIPIDEPRYKAKPTGPFKTRNWEQREFSRADGLTLKHWKHTMPLRTSYDDEFPMEKFNITVEVPSYTPDQYDALLKADDWSREETDYLLTLCREYDLRWIVIADRYEHPRSTEALKARFYSIASKMMAVNTPPDTMTEAEFKLWEKMSHFDPQREQHRKATAEKFFLRTKEEADEERVLLEELARITKFEDDFLKSRQDILMRLEIAFGRRSDEQQAAMLSGSSGSLGALLQSLLTKEKRRRPGMIDTGRANSGQDNGEAERGTARKQTWEKGQHPNQYTRRNTIDDDQKKPKLQNTRQLSRADEVKYGVVHPSERINGGVQFRHEKVSKIFMTKSSAVSTKIQAALVELGMPPRLLMPTERVCREYERLISDILMLLDIRKAREKVSSETRVMEENKRVRLGLPKDDEADADVVMADPVTADASFVSEGLKEESQLEESQLEEAQVEAEVEAGVDSDESADPDPDVDVESEPDSPDGEPEVEDSDADAGSPASDEQPPPALATRLQKRSASVVSDASRAGSNRSGVGRKKGRR